MITRLVTPRSLPPAGGEVNLLLKLPGPRKPRAIKIKRGLTPQLERDSACEVIRPERCLGRCTVVAKPCPLAEDVEALALTVLCAGLSAP